MSPDKARIRFAWFGVGFVCYICINNSKPVIYHCRRLAFGSVFGAAAFFCKAYQLSHKRLSRSWNSRRVPILDQFLGQFRWMSCFRVWHLWFVCWSFVSSLQSVLITDEKAAEFRRQVYLPIKLTKIAQYVLIALGTFFLIEAFVLLLSPNKITKMCCDSQVGNSHFWLADCFPNKFIARF